MIAVMKPDLEAAEKIWKTFGGDQSLAEQMIARTPAERREATAAGLRKILIRERHRIDKEHADIEQNLARLNALKPEVADFYTWVDSKSFILERPLSSCVHHARQAIAEKNAWLLSQHSDLDLSDYEAVLGMSNCFVVEHDWARAFEGATDFEAGEIRLPYEACAFDFKINSRRVIAVITTAPDSSDPLMQIMVRGKDFWLIDDDICRHSDGHWYPIGIGRSSERNLTQRLTEFIGAQIRAITIALDAQVAETETIRVSEKLGRSRQKTGQIAPMPYHVVSLARRGRSTALQESSEHEHGKVRLHFRRGHWRHYENHKTWIRWMLVGNPDLGFVDKHYRL